MTMREKELSFGAIRVFSLGQTMPEWMDFKKTMLTISAAKMTPFLKVSGVDTRVALIASGISLEVLSSPDCRLGSIEVDRLIRTIVAMTHNENIGLSQGAGLSKVFSNIVGYILMNCGTLGAAIEKYCRYEKIVDQISLTSLQIKGNDVLLSSSTLENPLSSNRQFSDYKMAGIHSYAKILSGERLVLENVYFTHSKPENTSEYQRLFGCSVHFGYSTNCLIFDRSLLNLPIIEPNEELLSFFELKAREMMASFVANETYTQKVTRIIIKEMRGELPSIEKVAQELKISARSLQMHLKNEATSFSQIIVEIRKDMAIHYLKSHSISIDEIAYILGFSESSAFHRAFKKWTFMTPGEFRNSHHQS